MPGFCAVSLWSSVACTRACRRRIRPSPSAPFFFPQNGAYIIKYVATVEEAARLARVQAVGDWLAELVALDGLKEDAHEWGPAIEATLAPGTRVGVSVSAWCLWHVWTCVHDGLTLCKLLVAGWQRVSPSHILQPPPHLPSPLRTPRAGAAEDEGGASESKLGGDEAEDDPLPFVGEYDSTSTSTHESHRAPVTPHTCSRWWPICNRVTWSGGSLTSLGLGHPHPPLGICFYCRTWSNRGPSLL